MGWKTFDFRCSTCEEEYDVLCQMDEGADPPDTADCVCGGTGHRIPSFGSTFKVALPMGNRRFDPIRRQRAVQREMRKAVRKGDKAEVVRLAAEKAKLKGD